MSSVIRGSDNFDSAVKSGTIEATASGALANGDMVIVNSDGTVSSVSGSLLNVGDKVEYLDTDAQGNACCYDSNSNKVVVVYADVSNSYAGTAVVGTISGETITFGTPVVFDSNGGSNTECVFDSANNKVVIVYSDNGSSYRGTIIVGSVSGDSISFGTPVVFDGSPVYSSCGISFDPVNNVVVVAYPDYGSSYHIKVFAGSVSGTSISLGSVQTTGIAGSQPRACYDPISGKTVVAYHKSDAAAVYILPVTVSGTSVSLGTSQIWTGFDSTSNPDITYIPLNQKLLVTARRDSNNTGCAVFCTVSGTSINLGTTQAIANNGVDNMYYNNTLYDPTNELIQVFNNYANGHLFSYGLSGDTLTELYKIDIYDGSTNGNDDACYDPVSNRFVAVWRGNSPGKGSAVVVKTGTTNATSENYIGVSDGNYADGATATVQIAGAVSEVQTGLTAGKKHYVRFDGSLSTASDINNIEAGTAISSTQLIVKG